MSLLPAPKYNMKKLKNNDWLALSPFSASAYPRANEYGLNRQKQLRT